MQIQMLKNGCLKAVLSEEDLSLMGLTTATIDSRDPLTQDMLQTVLAAAKEDLGFEPPGGIVVEAIALIDGCMLLFTPSGGSRRIKFRRLCSPIIFCFETAGQLIELAEKLEQYFREAGEPPASIGPTSLYAHKQFYGLTVSSWSCLPYALQHIFQEYATHVKEGALVTAFLAEHGEPLAAQDAVPRLCEAVAASHKPARPQSTSPPKGGKLTSDGSDLQGPLHREP